MGSIVITEDPIGSEEVMGKMREHSHCGARVLFSGTVRGKNRGREVRWIHYESHAPMARKELSRIIGEAKAKWEVHEIGIAHRLGRLAVGQTSLIVTACAPHRDAAFSAGEYIIAELKKRVPIFKKEIYADGTSSWLSG